ncbi:MAG TPA: cyclic nucleotide-binding domain-containing protein, partial [Myxococcales bacterium]|nr:cyclic nucleotide-binding domain-containing protein [Myxococcales bacterium]
MTCTKDIARDHVYGHTGPNDGFGEIALLTGEPRSLNIVALAGVETWCLSKSAID